MEQILLQQMILEYQLPCQVERFTAFCYGQLNRLVLQVVMEEPGKAVDQDQIANVKSVPDERTPAGQESSDEVDTTTSVRSTPSIETSTVAQAEQQSLQADGNDASRWIQQSSGSDFHREYSKFDLEFEDLKNDFSNCSLVRWELCLIYFNSTFIRGCEICTRYTYPRQGQHMIRFCIAIDGDLPAQFIGMYSVLRLPLPLLPLNGTKVVNYNYSVMRTEAHFRMNA